MPCFCVGFFVRKNNETSIYTSKKMKQTEENMKCKKCGGNVTGMRYCQICGTEVKADNKAKTALILSILGFCLGFAWIGILFDVIAIIMVLKPVWPKEKKNLNNWMKMPKQIEKKGKITFLIAVVGLVATLAIFGENPSVTKNDSHFSDQQIEQNVVDSGAMNDENDLMETLESSIEDVVISTDKIEEETNDSEIDIKTEEKTSSSSEIVMVPDEEAENSKEKETTYEYHGKIYDIIVVAGGNQSGDRKANVVVDIGYGERVYWGFTNEYGQLVYVIADEIILQNDDTEPVNSSGRYYDDEAYVPGVEASDLDQGHVIADSLGGVSNAYNITPQDSTMNRYGDQAYMEREIRDANGCTDFVATITYADTKTQIPSHYHFEYVLMGNLVVEDFENVNPDESNKVIDKKVEEESKEEVEEPVVAAPIVEEPIVAAPIVEEPTFHEPTELAKIDTNGNGKVTIAEAKAAGFSMPVYASDWLYKYMDDRDGDGMVGE
jgi:hypothetical protein